jgi:hypothetical protein
MRALAMSRVGGNGIGCLSGVRTGCDGPVFRDRSNLRTRDSVLSREFVSMAGNAPGTLENRFRWPVGAMSGRTPVKSIDFPGKTLSSRAVTGRSFPKRAGLTRLGLTILCRARRPPPRCRRIRCGASMALDRRPALESGPRSGPLPTPAEADFPIATSTPLPLYWEP